MNVLDLFSGIGGFSLGLESTGFFKTIAFVEKDKFCQKVLQKNFPNVPIEDEIRNVRGSRYQADVVTGGFPCQPFSVAGKRKGTDDDRYLWDETLRVIAETKPRWFVGENVEGIVNISEGKVLQQIQKDLESEGFQVQCLIIPASGVGAWHQRKRVWIIANSKSFGSNERRFRNNTQEKQIQQQIRGEGSIHVSNSNGRLRGRRRTISQSGANEVRRIYSSEKEQAKNDLRSQAVGCDAVSGKTELSNSKFKRLERWQRNDSGEKRKVLPTVKHNRSEMGSSSGCFNGKDEQQTWWQTQSRLRGVPHGISYELDKDRANRIKALGNSIVPEIAYEIAKAILVAENEQSH